ncbi:MAG TPA: ATP-binding protein [Nitrolancea sp.]|nr:ATP-binding protein [Nitrolancea sp.]
MESVANTLALAIDRRKTEEELWQRNAEMVKLTRQLTRLADERRRIMADALDAEDRARERISQALHDEVLQSLLSARQDLAKARRDKSGGDHALRDAAEAVVEAIGNLRSAVVALHPVTRARGGIAAAIRAVADLHAKRGGLEVTLSLQPQTSGVYDQLIVSLVGELLSNVAQHAEATQVTVSLRRTREQILLEVADNGRGIEPGRAEEALGQGHIGLASIAMRVESCGGRFELSATPGEGTRARAVLPAARTGGSSRSGGASRD